MNWTARAFGPQGCRGTVNGRGGRYTTVRPSRRNVATHAPTTAASSTLVRFLVFDPIPRNPVFVFVYLSTAAVSLRSSEAFVRRAVSQHPAIGRYNGARIRMWKTNRRRRCAFPTKSKKKNEIVFLLRPGNVFGIIYFYFECSTNPSGDLYSRALPPSLSARHDSFFVPIVDRPLSTSLQSCRRTDPFFRSLFRRVLNTPGHYEQRLKAGLESGPRVEFYSDPINLVTQQLFFL